MTLFKELIAPTAYVVKKLADARPGFRQRIINIGLERRPLLREMKTNGLMRHQDEVKALQVGADVVGEMGLLSIATVGGYMVGRYLKQLGLQMEKERAQHRKEIEEGLQRVNAMLKKPPSA